MGRGTIIAHAGSGAYDVRLFYAYRDRITARLAAYTVQISELETRITTLDAQILAEPDEAKKVKLQQDRAIAILQKASVEKLYEYYSTKMPADPTVRAWCADRTEDMTYGTAVGTIEIPGEPSTVLIRPAYSNRAVYSGARDGQLMPAIAGSPHQVLFNWMLLPGWQRHRPIYRAGTIAPDSLDYDANTCSVCLDAAYSSQLSLPAIDGGAVTDCSMGDDAQAEYLTASGEDFCSRNPGHPFCTQGEGSEINITEAMLAQLQQVNQAVNAAYGRRTDQSGLRVGDRWDVMEPGGSGDCEDFALTKMQALVDSYGWNPDNLKIVTAYTATGEYHAMLGVRTTNRGLVVIDVNYPEVMESGRVPYRLDKIALAAGTWKNYARRIDAVQIEYMSCNAGAFADGDRVVVEFTGQRWTSPKVVGFLTNPQLCGLDAWLLGNNARGPGDYSHMRWDYETDTWIAWGEIPGYEYGTDFYIRDKMFCSGSAFDFYLFGGCGRITGEPSPWTYDRSDHYTGAAWVVKQDMIAARCASGGFKIGTKHYVASGGQHEDNWDTATLSNPLYIKINPSNQNWEFDPATNSWAAKINCPIARDRSRAFTLFDLGYVFGGSTETPFNSIGQVLTVPTDFNAYNQISNSWITKQNMNRGRYRFAAGVINGQGYVFKGRVRISGTGDIPTNDVPLSGYWTRQIDKYSPTSNSWASAGSLETDPSNQYATGMATSGNIGFGFLEDWGEWDGNTDTFTARAEVVGRFSTVYDLDMLRG